MGYVSGSFIPPNFDLQEQPIETNEGRVIVSTLPSEMDAILNQRDYKFELRELERWSVEIGPNLRTVRTEPLSSHI